ncbi:MAG: VanZ family protein [Ignavibacteria bacterium]|nr:VanZ family protein [Ignavibacteria bacterium]
MKYQLPPMVWVVLIFFVSGIPSSHLRFKFPPGTDKVVHAFIYFVLCWLARRAFYNQNTFLMLRNSSFLGAFIFSVVYGLLDEYHQKFVPGRGADFYDLLADAGGALLYVAIAWMVHRPEGADQESSKS